MTYQIEQKSMRAAVLIRQREELHIKDVELPKSLAYGQVFVKLLYTTICGSQLGEIDGVKGPDHYLPHLLGHEGSALVLQTGPGVRHVELGDYVVMHWKKGLGVDAGLPTYSCHQKPVNAGSLTTFNEYAIVSENRLTSIDLNFDMRLAPLLGCAVTTGLGVVNYEANLKIGESIVIFGVGGVGLSMVQGASMTAGYPIIAVDRHQPKLDLALKMGATHTINTSSEDLSQALSHHLNSSGADVIVENTGDIKMIEAAYEFSQAQGRVVLVGVPKVGQKASLHTLPLHFGKVLIGSCGGQTEPHRDIPKYARLVQLGKLRLEEMISEEFSLDQINQAIKVLRNGGISGRALIRFP